MSPDRTVVQFLESLVYGNRKDLPAAAIRGALRALSLVYRTSIRAYLLPFDTGLRRKQRLSKPVISVGNLTVGGTGKTPTTKYLAEGLVHRGWSPAVLSYGYGGSLCGDFGIVSDGSHVLLKPDVAGDEPVMLAAAMRKVPVLICKDRARSGRVAVEDFQADVLLLDDGFQVWKLRRDFDIVLLDAARPFDNGYTLPAGRLREPPAALRRADCAIVVGACTSGARDDTLATVRRIAPEVPVFFGRFKPSAVASLVDGSKETVDTLRGKVTFALSAIANPASFEDTLVEAGAKIVGAERFPDHHLYSTRDINRVNRRAVENGTEVIVTTEKDAVKLNGLEFAVPVQVLRIDLEMEKEADFWNLISQRIESYG